MYVERESRNRVLLNRKVDVQLSMFGTDNGFGQLPAGLKERRVGIMNAFRDSPTQ